MIYFDNAATSWPKPPKVIDAINEACERAGNPGRGAHEAAIWSAHKIMEVREKLAELFCIENPLRIAFMQNGTMALNTAITMCNGEILTTSMDHNSVLRPCHARGCYSVVDAESNGNLDAETIIAAITPSTGAVIMTHASNLTGTVYDIEKVGAECRRRGILFVVDAAQTAGVVPIDVGKMNIDILCFTGHKGLLGPQGTGGIYVAPNVKVKPLVYGGTGNQSYELKQPTDLPDGLEAGTQNTHGIAGLGAALNYVKAIGVEKIWEYEKMLTQHFTQGIKQIKGIIIYGDENASKVGVVSINFTGMDSSEMCNALSKQGICVRGGAHCAPLAHKTIGTQYQGAVRFSFGINNTIDEIDTALELIQFTYNAMLVDPTY